MTSVVKNVRIKDGKLKRIYKFKAGQKRNTFAKVERTAKSWAKQMRKPK